METVPVTFQFALGDLVRWAAQPRHTWRVIERYYRQGEGSGSTRYRLHSATATQDAMAYEPDLVPVEDTP